MKVLIVGGGGREHAIVRKAEGKSPHVETLYCRAGQRRHGGRDAKCLPIERHGHCRP